MNASYGCVVLTEGRRPDDLRRALASLLHQRGVEVDIAVVGNGWEPFGLPDGVHAVPLRDNVGVPGGRSAGVPFVGGDLLLFLDDDASFPDDDALARIAELFAADERLAALSPRVADPTGRPPARHWVPRLRVGDRARSSEITVMWEGAVVIRRTAFQRVGGWPDSFFYLHEGLDLSWRLLDAGYRIWYAADVLVLHPAPRPTRRPHFHYFAGRNRVWVARRNLPFPLAAVHVVAWFLRTAAGVRSLGDAREVLRGYRDGLRKPAGERRPLRWRTVWRMVRVGRPPVV
jgi:GT2 family glycosyltransferase